MWLSSMKNNKNIIAIGAACRGRYKNDGSTEQKLEINRQEYSNAITTISKDSYVLLIDDTYGYDGIRAYDETCPTLRRERNGLKIIIRN